MLASRLQPVYCIWRCDNTASEICGHLQVVIIHAALVSVRHRCQAFRTRTLRNPAFRRYLGLGLWLSISVRVRAEGYGQG